jgi:methionyl-tRNA formyltransferase
MRVAVIGRGEWLLDSARLISGIHDVVLVLNPRGDTHYSASKKEFKSFSSITKARFLSKVPSEDYLAQLLMDLNVELVISANFPRIVSSKLLRIPKFGWLNAHPGPLPRYRGNACPNWAILNGEKDYALTVHKMNEELDSGPIYDQFEFSISDATYIEDIYRIMRSEFPKMFLNSIEMILDKKSPRDQIVTHSHICYPRQESDSEIDWDESADFISRSIRAYSRPFPGAFSFFNGTKIRIYKARVYKNQQESYSAINGQILESSREGILVNCGTGILLIEELSQKVDLKRRSRFT